MSRGNGKDRVIQEFLTEETSKELTEDQALELLSIAVRAMGWNMSIPNVDDDEEVPGLIIGKDEYIKWIEDSLGDQDIPHSLRMSLRRLNPEDEE